MLAGAGEPVIVPPDDELGYAAALATMAGRAELRASLGAANRARCVERYSVDRTAGAYAELYEAALGSAH